MVEPQTLPPVPRMNCENIDGLATGLEEGCTGGIGLRKRYTLGNGKNEMQASSALDND